VLQNNKVLSGGAKLFGGQILTQLIAFLRNFIVARLLIPEDFGVASTFAVTITALEMLSDFSMEKILVRDKDGDREDFQATVTTLNLLRNVILAAIVFFAAPWIADLFKVPEATRAYQLLALVPLVRGLVHMDLYRVQRRMEFMPEILSNIISQVLGLLLTAILLYFSRDYISVLWGVVVQSLVLVVVTHILAERRFKLGFDMKYVWVVFIFGWPLMVNGIVLMLSTQADRVLVGAQLGMAQLAQYTIAVLLVSVPGTMLYRVVSTVALPWLSEVQDEREDFQYRYDLFGHFISMISVMVFVPIIMIGSDVIEFVFGQGYMSVFTLVGWLSFSMALRFMRARMVNAFLAVGNTKDLMLSETARIFGIVFALIALMLGYQILSVAIAMFCGEVIAFWVCVIRLRMLKRGGIETRLDTYGGAVFAMLLALVIITVVPSSLVTRFIIGTVIVLAYIGLHFQFVPMLRAQLIVLWEQLVQIMQSRGQKKAGSEE
jgi:O-antigen/teichoic acid export membrane protein